MFRGRQERQEERQFGAAAVGQITHYRMRQNLISIGDDFWIEDERGRRVARVDGKALRVRQTLNFEDPAGNLICQIQERMLRIKDTLEIEGPGGQSMATIKKALITPVRERCSVNIGGGPDLEVQGNILDHEYRIEGGGQVVATVSKRWFRVADTYGVEIAPGQNDVLILAITTCVDMMGHGGR